MTEMLKGICIIVIVVCVGLMTYTTWNAIRTAKKNKRADETTRQMFLSQVGKLQDSKSTNSDNIAKKTLKQPLNLGEEKHTELNYEPLDSNLLDIPSDKTLKDFFKT